MGFIERQVKIATDPVFGNIQDAPKLLAIKEDSIAKPPILRAQESRFATMVTAVERKTWTENKIKDGHLSERTGSIAKQDTCWSCALYWRRGHRFKRLIS